MRMENYSFGTFMKEEEEKNISRVHTASIHINVRKNSARGE